MSSESPARKSKKVCFICGSYTALTINIYEPRSGPNIVDVINQKFRVQPLNEDKFLCYSCNNWLINWHSLQNKNDRRTEASSSKAGKNISRLNQSMPEEHQKHTMAVLVDRYSDVLQIRSRLQKYFYFPKKKIPKMSKTAIQRPITKCNLCGKPIRKGYSCLNAPNHVINKRDLRFCHKCKQTIRDYFNASTTLCDSRTQPLNIPYKKKRNLEQRSSQLKLVNPYVVSRLKKLGTTVICEGTTTSTASGTADNDLSHMNSARFTTRMKNREKIDQSVIQSNPNEIVISFNTALQEVFPVNLCSENTEDVVGMNVDEISDLSEIYRRIPKSLTITLV